MPLTEKKLFNELLDADTAPHLVSASAFINAANLRFGTADNGFVGYLQNITGNTEVTNTLPAGTNLTIGACADDTDRYLIFFNWNSNGDHGIYLYDILDATAYKVVEDADITGGLNFDRYKLINGAHVINGILYWNDNENEPRKLNLGVFMTASGSSPVTADYDIAFPIDDHEITIIRTPCQMPPSIEKKYNAGFLNNFIKNDSFQFAFEYGYYDGERAVLSPWSKATLLNLATENYNYVTVSFPLVQVPQTVKLVRLVVKDSLTSKAWVIRTWDRDNNADNTAISGNTISYDFYNNETGEFIDDATVVRPFHSVPILAGSLQPAKNRLNLLDITKGYDTPVLSSLTASITSFTVSLSTITVPLLKIGHRRRGISGDPVINGYAFIAYFVYIPGGNGIPEGYYMANGTDLFVDEASDMPAFPTLGAAPASPQAISAFTFKGLTLQNVYANTLPATAGVWAGAPTLTYYATNGTNMQITGLSTSSYRVFKSNSQYNLGVVFYDRYRRKCGVVFMGTDVVIPERNYAYTSGYGNILWTLDNTDALTEIPDWAHYYSVVITKNLRTRNFVSAYSAATCKYATRDADGLLVYTTTVYDNSVVAVAIDTKGLLQANLGYEFNENDQCVIIDNSDTKNELPVIGQDGGYILLAPKDIGTLTTKTFVYEVYTPYKQSEEEPFFEIGEVYRINDPGLSTREYDVLLGSIRADSVVISRNFNSTSYFAEAMSPNDIYFQRWFTDAGQAQFIIKQGQVRKRTGLCFSNVWIPGTQTNGLSAFEALNEEILPESIGTGRKLVLTNKLQAEGSVMLAIGENNTVSIYLGETQIFDANQNSFLAKSSGYIGQVNELQGGYGTQNPESVIAHQGQVFWADTKKYSIVRYGANGLYPISEMKIKRFFRLFCKKYDTMPVADIELLGSRPFLFGGIDVYHNEYMLCLPSTEQNPPKGWLMDYIPSDLEDVPLYGIQHRAYVSNATIGISAADSYQTYVSYYVYLDDINIPGYYIFIAPEALGTVVSSLPAHAALPSAPLTGSMAELRYAGPTIEDMLDQINERHYISTGKECRTHSYVTTETGTVEINKIGSIIKFPYDLYDGVAKVLVFKILENKWASPHNYEPEMFASVGVHTFAFKNGAAWENNTNPFFNSFFGTRSKSRIMFVFRGADQDASKVKVPQTISVEANFPPTFVHLRTETPNVQSSDLVSSDFKTREGIHYSEILRDRLSPNTAGDELDKLMKGDKMRGPWMYVLVEFDTLKQLQLKFINLGYKVAAGHEFV